MLTLPLLLVLGTQKVDTLRFTPTVAQPTFAVREPVARIKPGTVLISRTNHGPYYTEAGGAFPGADTTAVYAPSACGASATQYTCVRSGKVCRLPLTTPPSAFVTTTTSCVSAPAGSPKLPFTAIAKNPSFATASGCEASAFRIRTAVKPFCGGAQANALGTPTAKSAPYTALTMATVSPASRSPKPHSIAFARNDTPRTSASG